MLSCRLKIQTLLDVIENMRIAQANGELNASQGTRLNSANAAAKPTLPFDQLGLDRSKTTVAPVNSEYAHLCRNIIACCVRLNLLNKCANGVLCL